MTDQQATLYYVHDPMCSWCWGFKPCWDELKGRLGERFGEQLRIESIVGGLARDANEPMPEELQNRLQATWHKIHQQLGAEFNFDFWTKNQPRRSTYMSCRAVLAAQKQGVDDAESQALGWAMIEAIQKAYYLRALNPSDVPVLQQLAGELGLDGQQLVEDMDSRELQVEFREHLRITRSLPIQGFPSLVLSVPGVHESWITQDYSNPEPMFDEIEQKLSGLLSGELAVNKLVVKKVSGGEV